GALKTSQTTDVYTVNGFWALLSNTFGEENTAIGDKAFLRNMTGISNTATGSFALANNTSGSSNIALGAQAGSRIITGSNNIDIGNRGMNGDNTKIRIGTTGTHIATFIAGISGGAVPAGGGVIVGTDGKVGAVVSSARLKEATTPMDKTSEAILALKPVTFRYKPDLDPKGIRQFGLVAEEVEKVNPDLVARDEQGKPYSVRYEAVNAMLLNEFLKEHRTVQEQAATITQQRRDFEAAIAQQQKEIEALTATVKQQAAQIQKVSAQLELNKSAPQTVLNNQ